MQYPLSYPLDMDPLILYPFRIWFPIGTNGVSYNLALIFVALKGLLFSDNFNTQLIDFLNRRACRVKFDKQKAEI